MSLYSINDPKHWLDRAKEARALAEQMNDPEAKRTMLKNADDYERLAQKSRRTSSRPLAKVKVVVRSGEIARELAVMGYTTSRARRTRRHASKDAAIIPL